LTCYERLNFITDHFACCRLIRLAGIAYGFQCVKEKNAAVAFQPERQTLSAITKMAIDMLY